MSDSEYVTNESWLEPAGRPDTIDEIADQFERPATSGVQSFWSEAATARWPRSPRGWRSQELMSHRSLERRAG